MKRKDRQARRILQLQEQLHQLEAGRLSQLEMRANILKEEEMRLMNILDGNGEAVTIFPDLLFNKLRTTAIQQKALFVAVDKQAQAALDQSKRVKQAEKLLVNAQRDRARALEQDELRKIIDIVVKPADDSPP
jgi:hypothetical protein